MADGDLINTSVTDAPASVYASLDGPSEALSESDLWDSQAVDPPRSVEKARTLQEQGGLKFDTGNPLYMGDHDTSDVKIDLGDAVDLISGFAGIAALIA